MKKLSLLAIVLICLITVVSGQSKNELAIRKVLEEQRTSWNKGDIPGFMAHYWQNDSLMFIGKSGVTYGWQETLDNYKKGYPDAAAMGNLVFDILQVRQLSDTHYFVVGKWHLTRTIGDVGGHFSLLFRKIDNKWVIVADHSS